MSIIFSIWFGFYLGMPGTNFVNDTTMELHRVCASYGDTHYSIVKNTRQVQYQVEGIRYMSKMKGYTVTCIRKDK